MLQHIRDRGLQVQSGQGPPDGARRSASLKRLPSYTQLQTGPAAAHPASDGGDAPYEVSLLTAVQQALADGRTASYKLLVQASDIGGMGTDSTMFIRLFGCKGDFGGQLLDCSAQTFEPGKRVTSTFLGPDVGEIQRIQIYSSTEGSRSTCHLSHVDVFSSSMNEMFHFPIDDWIDDYHSLEHYFWRDGMEDMDAAALVEYHVIVYTSDIRWASADDNVSIELFGSNGFVGQTRVIATAYNLRCSHAVLFVVKGTDVGDLERIVIHHNKNGAGPTWHCHLVEVYNPSTQRKHTFSGSYSCNTRTDRADEAGGIRHNKDSRLELVFGFEKGQSPVLTFHLSKHAPTSKHVTAANVDQEEGRQSTRREDSKHLEGLHEALLNSATFPPASEEKDNQFANGQPSAGLASPLLLYKERTGHPADIQLLADLAASPPASEKGTGQLADNWAPAGSMSSNPECSPSAPEERTEQTFSTGEPPTDLAASPPASEERTGQTAGEQAPAAASPPASQERTEQPFGSQHPTDPATSPPAFELRTGHPADIQPSADPATPRPASELRIEHPADIQPSTVVPSASEERPEEPADVQPPAGSPPASEEKAEQQLDSHPPTDPAASPPASEEKAEQPVGNQLCAGIECGRLLGLPSKAGSDPDAIAGSDPDASAGSNPSTGSDPGASAGSDPDASAGSDPDAKQAPGRSYITRQGRILSKHELSQTCERLAIPKCRGSGPSNVDPRKQKMYKELPRVESGHPILGSPYFSMRQSQRCQTPMSARKLKAFQTFPPSHPGLLQSDSVTPSHASEKGVKALVDDRPPADPAAPRQASEKSVSLQSVVDHLPADHGMVSYKVLVQISESQRVGADTTIFIRLFGSAEAGGPLERLLDSSANVLEPGKLITFMFLGPDVGEVKQMQIYSSGSGTGSSWLLSHIDVFSPSMAQIFHFPINKWVKNNCSLEYFFWRDGMEDLDAAALYEYHVTVYTSDKRPAGTDVSVSIELFGSKGAVGQTRVVTTTCDLECKHAAFFVVKGADIGDLERIVVHQNNSGAGPIWHCQLVEVYDPVNQRKYTLSGNHPYYSWQGKAKKAGVERVQTPGLSSLWSTGGDVLTHATVFKTPKGRITGNLEVSQTFVRLASAKRSNRYHGCTTPIVVGQVQLIVLPSGRECWIPAKKVDPKEKEQSLCDLYHKGIESKKQVKVQLEEKYHLRPPKEPPKPKWIQSSSGVWTCVPVDHVPSKTPRSSVSGASAQQHDYPVFLSFRVAEANEQAIAVKKALESHGFPTFCSAMDLETGMEWVRVIANALESCKLVVIFATRTYGGKGTDVFGTGEEMTFALRNKKKLYVIPMSNQWTEPMTKLILGERQSGIKWTTAPETVPLDLLSSLLRTCKKLKMQKRAPLP